MKSQTSVMEETVAVQLAEEREPWALPASIFKARVKESDARAFYDGGAVSLLQILVCCFTIALLPGCLRHTATPTAWVFVQQLVQVAGSIASVCQQNTILGRSTIPAE